MKRRDQGISSAWSFLLGFVLLTLVVPGVLIGPARAVRLIASAVSGTVMQDAAARPAARGEHRLPLVDLKPEGMLHHNGVAHAVTIERSEQDDRIVRFQAPDNSPFGPYERIILAPPRSADMLGGQLAIWIAGRMGVPVPWKQLVYLKVDGVDAGIHEMTEFVDGSFEQHRNVSDGPQATYIPATEEAWRDAGHWRVVGAEVPEAAARLNVFIATLNDTVMTNAARRQQLESVIDVDAFTGLLAAMQVLGVNDLSQVRLALVHNPRTSRFYPVLTDALLVPRPADGAAGMGDLLSTRLMAIAEWRERRDRVTVRAVQELQGDDLFQQRMRSLSDEVAPSLSVATTSRRPLFSMRDPEHSAAALQWSADDLRSRVTAHWERMLTALAGGVETQTTAP